MRETVRRFERPVYFEVGVERNQYRDNGGTAGAAEVLMTLNGTCDDTLEEEIPQNAH